MTVAAWPHLRPTPPPPPLAVFDPPTMRRLPTVRPATAPARARMLRAMHARPARWAVARWLCRAANADRWEVGVGMPTWRRRVALGVVRASEALLGVTAGSTRAALNEWTERGW